MNASPHATDVRQQILDTAETIMSGKGFSAVGLNEILAAARVPKGSFYHYFSSKDAFGEALLESYFENCLADLDAMLERPGTSAADRLMSYWRKWDGKCMAVKLGAEVCDLSEAMRAVLEHGTTQVIKRLARTIEAGRADGSLTVKGDAYSIAETLYQLWLGATLLGKINRDGEPLKAALAATRQILKLEEPRARKRVR